MAEGARLESVYTFTGIGGSNPSLSAIIGAKEFSARTAQAGVGAERPVFGQPRADGALWNVAMETLRTSACVSVSE